jgi:hypothetical protein
MQCGLRKLELPVHKAGPDRKVRTLFSYGGFSNWVGAQSDVCERSLRRFAIDRARKAPLVRRRFRGGMKTLVG